MKLTSASGRDISLSSLYIKYFWMIAASMAALAVFYVMEVGTIATRSQSEALDQQFLQSLELMQSTADTSFNDTITQAYKMAYTADAVALRLKDRDYIYDYDAISLRLRVLSMLKMVRRGDLDLNVTMYTGVNDYLISAVYGAQRRDENYDAAIVDIYFKNANSSEPIFFTSRIVKKSTDPTYSRDVLTCYYGISGTDFIAFDIDIKLFSDRVRSNLKNGTLLILDNEGHSILSVPQNLSGADLSILCQESTIPSVFGDYGVPEAMFRAYTCRSKVSPMTCVLLVPHETFRLTRLAVLYSTALVMAFALILSLILAWIIARRVFRPIGVIRDFIGSRGKDVPQNSGSYEVEYILRSILAAYQQNSHLEKEQIETYEKMRSARVLALQQQMTPHFLYNTLQAIYWMSVEDEGYKESRTATSVKYLSNMARFCMEIGTVEIPVTEELEYVEEYLRLMKIRYGEKIRWSVNVADGIENRLLPRVSIQPLVENAVRHSLSQMENGILEINVEEVSDAMRISVRDNGLDMKDEDIALLNGELKKSFTIADKHIALLNLNQRLKLIHGSNAGVFVLRHNDMLEVGFVIPTTH